MDSISQSAQPIETVAAPLAVAGFTTPLMFVKRAASDTSNPVARSFINRMKSRGVSDAAVDDVLAALRDTAQETAEATLTSAEMEFALSAGMTPEDFSPEVSEANTLYELRSASADAERMRKSVLSTEQVAAHLKVRADNIRQQAQRGSLYAVGQVGGQKAFPRWQFTDGGTLPGLRAVLAVIPASFHPLDVEAVMTEPDDSLGDRSPVDWLATGGDVAPVVRLMSDLSLT